MLLMTTCVDLGLRAAALAFCVGLLIEPPLAKGEDFEAVSSKVSRDYVRKRAPNGSFVPETYAFAKGGYWSGPLSDATIDRLEFLDIARTLAVPLARQDYLPTEDPKETGLLLVVYWGTTYAPEHASESNAYNLAQKKASDEQQANQALTDAEIAAGQKQSSNSTDAQVRAAKVFEAQSADALSASLAVVQSENRTRDEANLRNASMLGYDSEWNALMGGLSGPAQDFKKAELLSELEEARYFVVVMAYDYQLLVREKKHKLLWETRFSIRQRNHAFNRQLAAMTVQASQFFGRDSNGLTRRPLPEGKVELGEVRDLGVVRGDQPKATPIPSSK
jgi:hypothetical protein